MEASRLVPGYRVVRSIGSGAAGAVYLAETSAGKRVALKVVSSSKQKACEELQQEYKILSQLEWPGIPRVYGMHRIEEGLCMVREYCEGTSLRNRMRTESGKVSRMIPDILERSGGMLQHMHDRGYVHRDFKPENLVVDSKGGVFLVDMALAWRQKGFLGKRPGLAGTPAYLAPELLDGKKPTPASDVYSYAVTAYELLAGQPPYQGQSREETLLAHKRGGAQPPSQRNPSVPPDLDRMIMNGLNKDPGLRPRNLAVYGKQLADRARSSTLAPARS
jgi:serine/threonine protein kinase